MEECRKRKLNQKARNLSQPNPEYPDYHPEYPDTPNPDYPDSIPEYPDNPPGLSGHMSGVSGYPRDGSHCSHLNNA